MLDRIKKKKRSFTFYETFLKCPNKFKFKYIDKIPEEISDSLLIGSTVHSIIASFTLSMNGGAKVDEDNLIIDAIAQESLSTEFNEEIKELFGNFKETNDISTDHLVGVEKKIETNIGDIPTISILDRMEFFPETKTLKITDYKTNRRLPSPKEFESNLQANMYAAVTAKTMKEVEQIEVCFNYLRFKRHLMKPVSDKTINETERYIHKLDSRILRAVENNRFKVKFCPDCATCSYIDRCSILKSVKKETAENIARKIIVIENQKRKLVKSLKKIVEEKGDVRVEGHRFSFFPQYADTYDGEMFFDLLRNKQLDPFDFISFDTIKLDSLFKKDPDFKEQITRDRIKRRFVKTTKFAHKRFEEKE